MCGLLCLPSSLSSPRWEKEDEHTLRACSLLLIPPPPPGELVRRESIPLSLADMAGPDWIKMVRDLASRMSTLPTGFCVSEQQVSSLLKKLERATGVPACRGCHYPRRVCNCALSQPQSFSGWSGGPNTATVEPFPTLTRTTATMSMAQGGSAPTTSVRATVPRTPPQGAVGISLRPSRPATPTVNQGSQTETTPSYAATASRSRLPAGPSSQEAPPSYAETRTADLAHAQRELMTSMANLTLRAPAVDFNEFQYNRVRPQSCFSNLNFLAMQDFSLYTCTEDFSTHQSSRLGMWLWL